MWAPMCTGKSLVKQKKLRRNADWQRRKLLHLSGSQGNHLVPLAVRVMSLAVHPMILQGQVGEVLDVPSARRTLSLENDVPGGTWRRNHKAQNTKQIGLNLTWAEP